MEYFKDIYKINIVSLFVAKAFVMDLFVGLTGIWVQTNVCHLGFLTKKSTILIGILTPDKGFTF